jgi:hypothetical protein
MRPPQLFFISSVLIFISCSRHNDKLSNEHSIASITYQAEMRYLDNRLFFYKTLSDKGAYYNKENELLEKLTNGFRDKIKRNEQITSSEQDSFLNHFEVTFKNSQYVDYKKYKELKKLPFKTVADVDLVKGYIKNCFIYILQDNKLLPFDTWGPLVCSDKQTIKYGETFNYLLSINAFNSQQPFEWYLVKDNHKPLTKENIIDTLASLEHQGIVFGETKKYKKGENNLQFLARLKTSKGDAVLPINIKFFVK